MNIRYIIEQLQLGHARAAFQTRERSKINPLWMKTIKPRLDVIHLERFAAQRIIEQIYMANREVIGGAPPGVDQCAGE